MGQISHIPIGQDRHGAVSLAESCLVRAENHGQMSVFRDRFSEGLVNQYLPRRVIDMVISSDDICYAKTDVIGDHGKVVGGTAI